jgi:integrase
MQRCQKSKSPYALMFLLLRQTGLRISELINLPFNPLITQNNASFLKVPLGKMNTERLVPLSEETLAVIRKIQNAYPVRPYGCNKARLIGLVGTISTARNNLDNHFKKITAEMTDQNKPITFHRLRHTYATTLLGAGVSIVSIMKLLGHRRIEMSLRYAKVTPNHLRDEYLKAVAVIENQAGLQEVTEKIKTTSTDYHPSEIIERLQAFIGKAARLDANNKKNILRKITRLKTEMVAITFNQRFKITR